MAEFMDRKSRARLDRERAEQAILDGPDGPARRFLLEKRKRLAAEAAKLPESQTQVEPPSCLSRQNAPLPPAEHESQSDEEFFASNPAAADDGGWEAG